MSLLLTVFQFVLYELGELAASQADNLSLVSAETNFLQMKQSRQTLRELAGTFDI